MSLLQLRRQLQPRAPVGLADDVAGEVRGAQAELAIVQRVGGVVGAID